MLSTGTFGAPSICLRCRVRQAIARRSFQPFLNQPDLHRGRAFTRLTRRRQNAEEQKLVDDEDGGDGGSDLSKYPLGRIIGKPGRRQREFSARLKEKNMDKPFEVIVLRDVEEPRDKTPSNEGALSLPIQRSSEHDSEHLASEILGEAGEPDQEEVEQSIDSLRPEAPVVDEQQYRDLGRKLFDGYSRQQLSRYLKKALGLSAVKADDGLLIRRNSIKQKRLLQITIWRSGTTPLEQRAKPGGNLIRSGTRGNKSKVVQQILRLAWKLSTQSELRQFGELEVSLEKWQIPYLFDLSSDGMPMYQAMLDSPLLRRLSDVRPYRPDNIMRITARRQDAEGIADQLESKLRAVKRLKLDMTSWPHHLLQLIEEPVLKQIGQRIGTVLERNDSGVIMLYGSSDVALQQTRQVLLSTMDLPSPQSTSTSDVVTRLTDVRDESHDHSYILLPDGTGTNLHLRHRDQTFSRLTVPSRRFTKPSYTDSRFGKQNNQDVVTLDSHEAKITPSANAPKLMKQLSSIGPFYPNNRQITHDTASYWLWYTPRRQRAPLWGAQFCKILHPAFNKSDLTYIGQVAFRPRYQMARNIKTFVDESKPLVVQPQVPGIDTLLSYFSPLAGSLPPPVLIAHFMPSPFTNRGFEVLGTLPRVQIAYKVVNHDVPSLSKGASRLFFLGLTARLAYEELRVPLPHEAIDMRFHRVTTLYGFNDKAIKDPDIVRFTRRLAESAENGDGTLYGGPNIKLRLPYWLFVNPLDAEQSGQDLKMEYVFERFEQVQTVTFVPNKTDDAKAALVDTGMRTILDGMPSNLVLRYKEIEGGVIGGQRTELSLQYLSPHTAASVQANEDDRGHLKLSSTGTATSEKSIGSGFDQEPERPTTEGEDMSQKDLRLVSTSLGLVNALTRINAGDLGPLQL